MSLIIFVFSACTRWDMETAENAAPGGVVLDSMDQLESGQIYIMHAGKFYKPVLYDSSFPEKENNSTSPSRTAFFSESEFSNIPTLYPEDSLIYYAEAENFSEKFYFERFEYVGYSVGICNLEKTASGRYSFTATTGNKNVDPDSDAARMLSLNEDVIIDSIGQAELRSGNISRGGIILGLEKNKYYEAEVYVGSKMQLGTVKADSVCLTSMSGESLKDYEFLRSKILEIRIPDNYRTGYYMVDGTGIFRYVKEKTYNAKTDFNIPNERTESQKEENKEQLFKGAENAETKVPFTIRKDTDVEIEVIFEADPIVEYKIENPVVKVFGYNFSRQIPKTDGKFFERLHLATGEYTLQISGVDSRAFKYEVRAVMSSEDVNE